MDVDQLEKLGAPAIGSKVELEEHSPDLVRLLYKMEACRTVSQAYLLLVAGKGPLQDLIAPEAMAPTCGSQSSLRAATGSLCQEG